MHVKRRWERHGSSRVWRGGPEGGDLVQSNVDQVGQEALFLQQRGDTPGRKEGGGGEIIKSRVGPELRIVSLKRPPSASSNASRGR